VTHAEAEKLFAGSEGEGVDDEALANPDGTLIELYVGYLNLPTVGRTVLGDARYGDLMQKLEPGQHALWVASTGRDRLLDDSFVPGTAPPKLQLTQGGYPAEMRDLVFEHPAPPGAPEFNSSGVFRVYAASNLDPAQAMQLTLTLTRAKGIMLPRITNKSVSVDYTLPDRYFVYPPKPLPEWLIAWQGRWPDLALIGAALVLLSAVLAKPQWMARDARRLVWFRSAFLLFTLVFIGWYAQGQLSIVQITGAIKTLMAGQNLASFLYDPVSLLIIAFTLVSFFIWGRGTFCGWLCPFGALQEFVAMAARKLRVPQIRLPAKLARVLDRGRYVILLGLVGSAAFAPDLAGSWSRWSRSRRRSRSASTAPGRMWPGRSACCWRAPSATSSSAASCARSAPPWCSAASCAASTGSRGAPNAASHARPAVIAANTMPSTAAAKSATTTASSAWTASAFTPTKSAARRNCCMQGRAAR
jgi:NosR/NirI family nitrous oxide reductase transcriptional regulator